VLSTEVEVHEATPLPAVIVAALGAPPAVLGTIVDEVLRTVRRNASFTPLFVVDTTDFGLFRRHDLQFAFLLTREVFSQLEPADEYDEYVEDRLRAMVDLYQPVAVVDVGPGDELALLFGATAGLVDVGLDVLTSP
jgi:hypothetical protein